MCIRDRVNMLDRYGVKGTFNVISGKLGGVQSGHNLLQMYDVKRVYQKHEASMHGYTHLPLRDENITAENIETEITKDRQRIKMCIRDSNYRDEDGN